MLALPEVGGLTVIEDLTLCDDLFDIEDWFVLQLVAGDHLLIYGSSPTTFSAKLEAYLPDGVTPIDDRPHRLLQRVGRAHRRYQRGLSAARRRRSRRERRL